jgi:periplasmic protein TonB
MKHANTGTALILLVAVTSLAIAQAPKTARAPESWEASCPPPGTGPGQSTAFDPCMYLKVPIQGIPAPKVRFAPNPEYPELARESRTTGVVVVAVAINGKGTVDAVRIERSLKPEFDQSAIAAVRRWEFVPAMNDGHPVAVQMHMEINFQPQ